MNVKTRFALVPEEKYKSPQIDKRGDNYSNPWSQLEQLLAKNRKMPVTRNVKIMRDLLIRHLSQQSKGNLSYGTQTSPFNSMYTQTYPQNNTTSGTQTVGEGNDDDEDEDYSQLLGLAGMNMASPFNDDDFFVDAEDSGIGNKTIKDSSFPLPPPPPLPESQYGRYASLINDPINDSHLLTAKEKLNN